MTSKNLLHLMASAILGASLLGSADAQTVVFSTDFETDQTSNFTVVPTTGRTDFVANFTYDYSTFAQTGGGFPTSIPASPNSTSGTTALRLEANTVDGALMAVGAFPTLSFDFNTYDIMEVKFDSWVNYNGGAGGGSGSTETNLFGILGSAVPLALTSSGATVDPIDLNGVMFGGSGEGGAGQDYRLYEGPATGTGIAASDTAGFNASDLTTGDGDDQSEWVSFFPTPTYETAGAWGKAWNENVITLSKDGAVTWTVTNADGVTRQMVSYQLDPTSVIGTAPFVGYGDAFGSLADPASDNFGLFDNIVVSGIIQLDNESWNLYN